MDDKREQLKVSVNCVFAEQLRTLAARDNRSLSNLLETLLIQAYRHMAWGEVRSLTRKRDGRPDDSLSVGGTD